MKIFIVMDGDYDSSWVVAVYASQEHADMRSADGGYTVTESDVLEAYAPDEKEIAGYAERNRQSQAEHQRYLAHCQSSWESAEAQRPDPPHMRLCHCRTFSKGSNLLTKRGYCKYCGGWTPEVFREHIGEAALLAAIGELAIHDRDAMLVIISAAPSDAPVRSDLS